MCSLPWLIGQRVDYKVCLLDNIKNMKELTVGNDHNDDSFDIWIFVEKKE